MSLKKINLLITGSSGYVGTNLINAALKNNFNITALSRNKINHKSVNSIIYKLENELPPLPNDIDVLIHAAADMTSNPISEKVEIYAAKKLIKWANLHNIRFIFISSCLASKESQIRYGRVKYLIENLVKKENGIIIRPTFIYGGIHKGSYKDYFTFINKSFFLPYFVPTISIQPLYIFDLCSLILNLSTRDNLQITTYNAGYKQKVDFHKLIICLIKYKIKKRKIFIPMPTFFFESLLFCLSLFSKFFEKKYISFKYYRKTPFLDTKQTTYTTNIKFKSLEESFKLEENYE